MPLRMFLYFMHREIIVRSFLFPIRFSADTGDKFRKGYRDEVGVSTAANFSCGNVHNNVFSRAHTLQLHVQRRADQWCVYGSRNGGFALTFGLNPFSVRVYARSFP